MTPAKVLVVDDEERVLRFAETVLRTGGYEVIRATDAEQALTIIDNQAEAVDIVLSDVRMPGMSGPQLVKSVRESFPATAVVLMSGHIGSEEIDPSIPIIPKPFTPAALLEYIREIWAFQQDLMAQLKERCIVGGELIKKNEKLVTELRAEIVRKGRRAQAAKVQH